MVCSQREWKTAVAVLKMQAMQANASSWAFGERKALERNQFETQRGDRK
jgi:hypothetical protein